MDPRVVGAQQRIDVLEAKARSLPVSDDIELQAQLARFLCVLSSGLIEQAVVAILETYAKSGSRPQVSRFVGQQLSKFRNAKFKDILAVLNRFDPAWGEHFRVNTSAEMRDAIDSIVNNRNQIAHGQQTSISLVTFSSYYKNMKTFIGSLDSFITSRNQ